MKTYLLIFGMLLPFALFSQNSSDQNISVSKVGFGLAIQNEVENWHNWLSATNFLMTIDLNDDFRFEPEIGYSGYKQANDLSGETQYQNIVTALNSYFLIERDKLYLLPGLRTGYARNTAKSTSDGNESGFKGNSFFVGPVFGIEYFIVEKISLGAEFKLLFSKEKSENWNEEVTKSTQNFTASEFKLRFYL